MKNLTYTAIFITFYFAFVNLWPAAAQTSSVLTTGLQGPTKIVAAGSAHLLVSETGTPAPNSSRISLVDRATGARRTLIDGLPSGFNTVEQSPSGASGLKLSNLKLYVTIGQGDSVKPGGRGDIVANPYPATPLNNSVLELILPADYEVLNGAFTLTLNHQKTLAGGSPVTLQNAEGKILGVRLVANLPDYKMEPRPFLPQGNVRPANVFGVETAFGSLYVVDASFNQLYKIDPATGAFETFAVFAPRPNPLPFGPPFSEAVPSSVRLVGNQLLVPTLIGFPFPQNVSQVRQVSLVSGLHTAFIENLTSAIDVLPVPFPGNFDCYYVLEFSANFLGQPQAPGRLKLFVPANNQNAAGETLVPVTLLTNLVSPTSLARDPETGDLFVTEIFPGRIIRVEASQLETLGEETK